MIILISQGRLTAVLDNVHISVALHNKMRFSFRWSGGEMFYLAIQRPVFFCYVAPKLWCPVHSAGDGKESEYYALEMFMGQTWRSPHYIHLIL